MNFRKVSPRNAADYLSAVLLFNGAYIRLYQRIISQRAVFHPKGAGERPNLPQAGLLRLRVPHRRWQTVKRFDSSLRSYSFKLRSRRANSCFGTGHLGSSCIASKAATTWDVVSMAAWCMWSMIHRRSW